MIVGQFFSRAMIAALVFFGISLLAGAAAIAWFVSQKRPVASGPRYLVVEANDPGVAPIEDEPEVATVGRCEAGC